MQYNITALFLICKSTRCLYFYSTHHIVLDIPENDASVEDIRFKECVYESVGVIAPFVIRSDVGEVYEGVNS